MSDKFFLDTNILVYAFDLSAPRKCKIARNLIATAIEEGTGVIGFQVVQEFVNFALKAQKRPMKADQVQQYFQKVLKPLCAVHSSIQIYLRAFSILRETKFSWFDSIILACAEEAGCSTLYTEDMQNDRQVGAVRICNPFV